MAAQLDLYLRKLIVLKQSDPDLMRVYVGYYLLFHNKLLLK